MNPRRCDCAEAMRETHRYIDDALEADARAAVEEHLLDCPTCNGRVVFHATLRKTVARVVTSEPLPDDLVRRLMDRLGDPDEASPDVDTPRE